MKMKLSRENISFPSFKYQDLVQQEWEDSDLKLPRKKFFFVFFKHKGNKLLLKKVKFWNMSQA